MRYLRYILLVCGVNADSILIGRTNTDTSSVATTAIPVTLPGFSPSFRSSIRTTTSFIGASLLALFFLLPLSASAAIAFDVSTTSSSITNPTATELYATTTIAANSTILIACTFTSKAGGGNINKGVRWNGSEYLRLATSTNINNNDFTNIYYLVNPTTGTHSFYATSSAAAVFEYYLIGASYTGVLTTGVPEAIANGAYAIDNQFLFSTTTTITNNAWPVMCGQADNGVSTAGPGTTVRQNDTTRVRFTLADKGAPQTPAGQNVLSVAVVAGTTNHETVGIVLAPTATAAPAGIPLWAFFPLGFMEAYYVARSTKRPNYQLKE